jgi:hypothetical protein
VEVLTREIFADFDSLSIITKELIKNTTRRITRSGKIIFNFRL